MGKANRKRWVANVKSMEIISKSKDEITDDDIKFLKENYTSMGGLIPSGFNGGAFFTPTHVAKFMWEIVKSKLPNNARVLEPSVGSGVFLEHAPDNAEVTALELDETSAKVTSLIYPNANVIEGNAILHNKENYYDIVIGNPPYGETILINEEDGDFSDWVTLRKTKGVYKGRSESVFLEHAIRSVKYGGYIAFIMPMGISYSQHAAKVRKLLYDTCWQVATIMLPGETFQHVGTTIPTQIIVVRKVTPNAKKIKTVETKWRSNFRRSDWTDLTQFDAKYFEGQTPAYFAKVTDIGWDNKGKSTDKWGDGLTQLDELARDFNDNNLMRENLYPHIPSWTGNKDVTGFFFSHANDTCDGYRDAKLTFSDGPYRWNELTLGSGKEVIWNGEEISTFDFDWQDQIVDEYYQSLEDGDVSE